MNLLLRCEFIYEQLNESIISNIPSFIHMFCNRVNIDNNINELLTYGFLGNYYNGSIHKFKNLNS